LWRCVEEALLDAGEGALGDEVDAVYYFVEEGLWWWGTVG
jgi:hypothetical protein